MPQLPAARENTLPDVDDISRVCAITLKHASERTDLKAIELEGLAA